MSNHIHVQDAVACLEQAALERMGGARMLAAALDVAESVDGEMVCVNKRKLATKLGMPLSIPRRPPVAAPEVDASGPGTELKKLLKKAGIEATPNCSCNARARVMDERGIEWCEANIDQIVGWLREEATNRGLPFVDMAGRMLVRRAIKNAKKAAAKPPSST